VQSNAVAHSAAKLQIFYKDQKMDTENTEDHREHKEKIKIKPQ